MRFTSECVNYNPKQREFWVPQVRPSGFRAFEMVEAVRQVVGKVSFNLFGVL